MFSKKNKLTIDQTRINLAPKDPYLESFLGKITTWALSVGRYLVIFTELTVIISFLTRFQLDRQVTDLNSSIVKQQRIIESYGDLEQNVRDVQKKILDYNQLKVGKPMKEIFEQLTAITPEEIKYQELDINSQKIIIHAHANSRQALDRFILNIQASNYFLNPVSDNISNKDSRTQGYDFQISAQIGELKTQDAATQ
ncbi:MAG: PilN domain-containing protein [Patescibacteria group bacterium]